MHKRRLWPYGTLTLLAAFLVIGGILYGMGSAYAVTSTSPHYQVTETQFNASSSQQSCSGQYCAKASIGDTSIGMAGSESHTAQFGSITKSDPLLEVIVDPGVSNLGTLSTETTATKTTTVKVRNYLSGGYTLQIMGDPPKYSGHSLATNSEPTASIPGTEQFGINVTGNTTPNVGKVAEQVPSDTVSFGVVDTKYRQANMFLFHSGDVVAKSATSSGQTNYTISMIVNISSATPAGHYSGDFSAVVIPAY
jgi:hypothetical protein